MTAAAEERGFTLIEMLVAMIISTIVMGSVVTILTVFLNDNRYDQYRDSATSHAQIMVDRLSRELRSAASPTVPSAGLLADAGPYDVGFQSVNPTAGTPSSSNPTNQIWVRYCLGANNTLWRQSTTVSSSTSAFPDPLTTFNGTPSTFNGNQVDASACPSTSSNWITAANGTPCCIEQTDVVNEIGGDNRPLFTYGPSGYSGNSQIKSVEIDMYVDQNPGHRPGPTHLTSGVFLRNDLAPPVSQFVVDKTDLQGGGADITLDGSLSSDPNGQVLSYQWFQGSSCSSPSVALTGGTTQQFNAGDVPNGNYTYSLLVTNTGGLTNCSSQTVAVP
jgi:prepilin-type N-terminal cleavage/methylation domain-containing protein